MKYGLFKYSGKHGYINIGDYIQSIAAKQYLPEVDFLINRDDLNAYSQEECKLIMNGWFTHKPENWPPSEKIKPLFISFHVNSTVSDSFFTPENIAYLNNNAPIGCRDYYTLHILEDRGIESYYSGCLTLTLGKTFKRDEISREILFVDTLFDSVSWTYLTQSLKFFIKKGILNLEILKINQRRNFLKKIFAKEILDNSISITHMIDERKSEEDRFKIAEDLLKRYSKAKLVVTSRIHCALPCIAMGTPVIFLYGGFDNQMDQVRFDGILDYMNVIKLTKNGSFSTMNFSSDNEIDFPLKFDSKISNPPFPQRIISILEETVNTFIKKK